MKNAAAAILILSALLAGCAGHTVYEVAVGVNSSQYMPWTLSGGGGFDGPRDTVRMSVRYEFANDRAFVGFSHISHLSAGVPFNNKREDWLDMFEIGLRFDSRQW